MNQPKKRDGQGFVSGGSKNVNDTDVWYEMVQYQII